MSSIPRAIESLVEQTASEYAVLLVAGPRQVGKSTLLVQEDGVAQPFDDKRLRGP